MKIPTFLLLSFVPLLTFSRPIALAYSQENFTKCLKHASSSSESMSKVIYTPTNSSYTSTLQFSINNLRFASSATPKPLFIVQPVDETQIQTVIYCSKKHGMEIRIRGGGYDFEGLSYVSRNPFVVLDMINLRSINVDPVAATAWVQSGATLGELYYKTAKKSKTLGFPGGVWSNVGVGGLISVGGYGTLRRKYGLAADNVIDARLIDVSGRILNRKSMGEDLFWAIRGGGASSFGVVLSWQIKLVHVPEIVTVFQVDRILEQNATEIVHKWQSVAPKLPKDLEIRIVANSIRKDAPSVPSRTTLGTDSSTYQDGKTVRLRFVGMFLSGIDTLLPLMQKRFPELGLMRENCNEVSYIQSVLLFSLFSADESVDVLLNRTSFKIPFKAKSSFVDKPISRKGLEGIWEMLLKTEPETTNMILTSYGRRMDEISEPAIPFPHRAGTLYMMYMRVLTDGDTTKAMNWIRSLFKYLTPHVTRNPRTAYVNYNDLDLGVNNQNGLTSYSHASNWGKKYFKNNFDRLIQVKSRVDPDNFFRHEQSIPLISYKGRNF